MILKKKKSLRRNQKMKNEIDKILGMQRNYKKRLDIDSILPMIKNEPKEIRLPKKPGMKDYSGKIPPIIIENHFHGITPNQQQQMQPENQRKFLSTLETMDSNGMPVNTMQRPLTKQVKSIKTNNILNDFLGE
jgi:hypothetical protein